MNQDGPSEALTGSYRKGLPLYRGFAGQPTQELLEQILD
jgi:hypothetical protein